jgi:hypothetical protein
MSVSVLLFKSKIDPQKAFIDFVIVSDRIKIKFFGIVRQKPNLLPLAFSRHSEAENALIISFIG